MQYKIWFVCILLFAFFSRFFIWADFYSNDEAASVVISQGYFYKTFVHTLAKQEVDYKKESFIGKGVISPNMLDATPRNLYNVYVATLNDTGSSFPFYVLLHYWGLYWGLSYKVLKLVPFLFGFLFVPLAMWVRFKYDGNKVKTLLTGFFAATHFLVLYHSQILRTYTFVSCLLLVVIIVFIKQLNAKKKREVFFFGLLQFFISLVFIYSHFLNVLILCGMVLYILITYYKEKKIKTSWNTAWPLVTAIAFFGLWLQTVGYKCKLIMLSTSKFFHFASQDPYLKTVYPDYDIYFFKWITKNLSYFLQAFSLRNFWQEKTNIVWALSLFLLIGLWFIKSVKSNNKKNTLSYISLCIMLVHLLAINILTLISQSVTPFTQNYFMLSVPLTCFILTDVFYDAFKEKEIRSKVLCFVYLLGLVLVFLSYYLSFKLVPFNKYKSVMEQAVERHIQEKRYVIHMPDMGNALSSALQYRKNKELRFVIEEDLDSALRAAEIRIHKRYMNQKNGITQ